MQRRFTSSHRCIPIMTQRKSIADYEKCWLHHCICKVEKTVNHLGLQIVLKLIFKKKLDVKFVSGTERTGEICCIVPIWWIFLQNPMVKTAKIGAVTRQILYSTIVFS